MNKSRVKKLRSKLVSLKAYYVAAIVLAVALLLKVNFYLALAIASSAYFSWEIFVDDLKDYKVSHFNLIGLLISGGLMGLFGAHFDISILRGIIFFFIGWGMFQLFEGDIGGGDVRLVTVLAIFLNTVQILSAISLAAAAGMLIASNLKLKRVPFGTLLIASAWLTFGIVRF